MFSSVLVIDLASVPNLSTTVIASSNFFLSVIILSKCFANLVRFLIKDPESFLTHRVFVRHATMQILRETEETLIKNHQNEIYLLYLFFDVFLVLLVYSFFP